MPELSTALHIWRSVGDLCRCHVSGVATDSGTTSVTVNDHPFITNRSNASDRRIMGTDLGVGDEIYLTDAQASSTLSAALTAAATSFAVAGGGGAGFAASTARPYTVAVDQERMLVTRSTDTFTVLARGTDGTQPQAHVSGATVYGPVRTPNPNSIGAYESSTGVFTPGVDYNADPGTTMPFDIFGRGTRLLTVMQAVNEALRESFYEDYVPLTLVADGDMRSPGTANWTAAGSPTVSKVTNSNAIEGPRSLRVLATVANDYVQSATILTDPTYSPLWHVRALLRADVGTGTLRAYDVTNSASITTETWSLRGWGILDFQFTLPATCEALAFQLESDTSTSDVYWAYLQAQQMSLREMVLPDWVTSPGMIKNILRDKASRDRWDDPDWEPVNYHLVPDPQNPNNQYKVHFDAPLSGPLWLHANRPAELLVADAQTTFVERNPLVLQASMKLCEAMMLSAASEEGAQWRRMYQHIRRQFAFDTWTDADVHVELSSSRRNW